MSENNIFEGIGKKDNKGKSIISFNLLSKSDQRFWNSGGRGGEIGYLKFEQNKKY